MSTSSVSRVGQHLVLERARISASLLAQRRAARTASSSASLWKGLSRNATAPACRDRRRVSSSPCAVRMTTRMRESLNASCRRRSRPLIPGICRSSTRQPVFSRWADLKNSSAEANVSTPKPTDRRRLLRDRRRDSSSSTTEITGLSLLPMRPSLSFGGTSESGRSSTRLGRDRKSTRLNSSHLVISYAVFCLKKKKKNIQIVFLLLLFGL